MHHIPSEKRLIAQFTAFLTLVVRNARGQYLRQKIRYDRDILSPGPDFDGPVEDFDTQYTALRIPQDSFEFEEERLARVFSQLPGLKQQVLKYYFIDDMETSEIASLLGIKESHARLIKYRAIDKLRKLILEGDLGDERF